MLLLLLIFIFGLCLGSFLNVLILRLKESKSLLGRSQCPHCQRQLTWYENVPVASFIFLRGKCRTCYQPISWQYPLVELASGVLWVVSYAHVVILSHGEGSQHIVEILRLMSQNDNEVWLVMTAGQLLSFVTLGFFFSVLLVLFVFDFRWYILPDQITIPAIVMAIILQLFLGASIVNVIVAGILGAIWFALQYLISKGKWVGDGDIRLGALIGVILGSFQLLVVTFFIAYVGGAIIALILLLFGKKQWGAKLPMGAFLTTATVIALLWGGQIWAWYMGFLW